MTNEEYRRLRTEIRDEYHFLKTFAYVERNISNKDFDSYFPMWCDREGGGIPIQISMNVIINQLDNKYAFR